MPSPYPGARPFSGVTFHGFCPSCGPSGTSQGGEGALACNLFLSGGRRLEKWREKNFLVLPFQRGQTGWSITPPWGRMGEEAVTGGPVYELEAQVYIQPDNYLIGQLIAPDSY